MKLRLISVGKDRSGLFEPAVQEYASRLKRYARLELLELKARATRAAEAEDVLSRVAPAEHLVALDERGRAMGSAELAAWLGRVQREAKDVAFVVGGDEGLDPSVLERAALVLSLSKMTLPHRLARVVVAEQLYRAFTLLRGEPYHK
ncbi:MAG TPA: 23S rRNA (pseudouridine(1915)-N(3))-methyltransferase RlmH [Myxococcales bacterium]|nr:23S rRNA (pseudouridine(1915)-N(3))-methyltransferase RlmH [Myxococcales bacterium]